MEDIQNGVQKEFDDEILQSLKQFGDNIQMM